MSEHALWLEYHEQPVQLHSGGWSHWLVRSDLIFEDEDLREAVLTKWENIVRNKISMSSRDRRGLVFVGIPRGGLVWAEAIAQRFQYYTDKVDDPVDPIRVVVDDVFTTGASLQLAQTRDCALIVVDRSRHNAVRAAWAHIPLPLCEEPAPKDRSSG